MTLLGEGVPLPAAGTVLCPQSRGCHTAIPVVLLWILHLPLQQVLLLPSIQ